MLEIVVGIKWVPDTARVRFDPVRGTLIREGVESIINPPDLNAIELALALREKYGGRVTVMSMAPPSATTGLKLAVAMGADKGILISDKKFAGADTLATAYTLSSAIRKLGRYDLILVGEETIDSSTGQVGPEVASILNLPCIAYVNEVLDVSETRKLAVVSRRIEEGVEVYEVDLPAVLTVCWGINTPRYPIPIRRLGIELETEKYLETWTFDKLGVEADKVGLLGSPTRVIKIRQAPVLERKREVFKGSPDEAVEWLVRRLREVMVG